MLATPENLRTLLDEDIEGLPDTEAALLLELATGAVQAAAGQEITYRTDDTVTLMGTTGSWLGLPQCPVVTVDEVNIDGREVRYRRFGGRLWREHGWSGCPYTPSVVTVTYSHGYRADDPGIQLARSTTLALASQMYANPVGATGFSIDDYREQYSQSPTSDLAGLVPAHLRRALRRQYGLGSRLVRVG